MFGPFIKETPHCRSLRFVHSGESSTRILPERPSQFCPLVTAVFFTCRRSSNTSASVSKMPWKRREQAHHLIPINKHQKNQRLEWTIWGYTCCQPERRNSIWSGIKINFSKSITVIFRCSVVYLISFMSNRMQTVRDKSVKKNAVESKWIR